MIDIEDIREGVVVLIKSAEHWDIEKVYCDSKYFSTGLDPDMHKYFGKAGAITSIHTVGVISENDSVDIKFPGIEYEWTWDIHCIDKILTKDENPEYFL